ncbi:MAG: agmatine deiminase family protein [Bacteroidales bacterium]|nr:agmatine deiminase family protein [Bacteroidales bacterium]
MMKKVFTLLLPVLLLAFSTSAQDNSSISKGILTHEMTPDELLRKGEIGRNFVETDPPAAAIRNVAEFNYMQGALVRYPFGIPISLIKEMATDIMVTTIVASTSQKSTVISQYLTNGVDTSHCNFLIAPTDSYWTRDYGPWFESDSANQIGIIDFPYNRPRPNDDEIPKKMAEMLGIPWFGMNVISTGGNYMTDGFGISSSTDLVWSENPTQTSAQIAQKMNSYLGISNYQVVPDPNISSDIDHIDCWGKFLAPDKILIRKTLISDPEYNALESAASYWASQVSSFGNNYKVFRVMTPQDQPYSNSVILNNKVLIPFMNSPWDDSAKAVYEAAMPGYQVIGFTANPSTPWLSTDALHCRVMGIADIGLLYIKHIPLTGNQPCESDYEINAEIFASSHQPIIDDSVIVQYQVNGGPYHQALMLNTTGHYYKGIIPKQSAGSVIKYYLTAADQSGRHASAPFIGSADPYTFQTTYTNLTPMPDTLWFITPDDCLEGKITQLHNFLADGINLTSVQQNGISIPWYVDSMSVSTLPYMVNSGDSFAIRVRSIVPLKQVAGEIFVIDTLNFTTSAGNNRVIIMYNADLLQRIQNVSSDVVLGNCYPNPFTETTNIPVNLSRKEKMVVDILNITGKVVKRICSKLFDAGNSSVSWDGTNEAGEKLNGGIYICRITTQKNIMTKRLVLIR